MTDPSGSEPSGRVMEEWMHDRRLLVDVSSRNKDVSGIIGEHMVGTHVVV